MTSLGYLGTSTQARMHTGEYVNLVGDPERAPALGCAHTCAARRDRAARGEGVHDRRVAPRDAGSETGLIAEHKKYRCRNLKFVQYSTVR